MYRKGRSISQRVHLILADIRRTNEEFRQRDSGMVIRHRTLTPSGDVLHVGPTIEAVPVQKNSWAA